MHELQTRAIKVEAGAKMKARVETVQDGVVLKSAKVKTVNKNYYQPSPYGGRVYDYSQNNKLTLVGSPFNLKVDPNPANELINVSFTGINDDGVTLQIVNAIGKVVLTMNVPNNGNHSIDISNFEKGVYLLRVNNSNYSETQKIIKQ